jgi:hypothetical protein
MPVKNNIQRYPLKAETKGDPFILFTRHRARYHKGSINKVNENMGHVAMYMPMGVSINDNMVFETVSTGLVGSVMQNGIDPSNYNSEDLMAAINTYGDEAAMAVGGKIGFKHGVAGAFLGGAGLGGVAKSAINENQKKSQISINPREFMLFKSPGMRSFSLRFRFIPDSLEESKAAEEIVKWFREGMYPEVAGKIGFKFPDAFEIKFEKSPSLIKIPEVYLESASVTYNPNSMSYFRVENRPVEINLSLEFKELQPMTRDSIQEGF